MLSYRFMSMDMDGNRGGTRRIRNRDVLFPVGDPDTFPVTPTRMDMEMHGVGLMVGWSDRLTLMAMMPFVRLDMDHQTRTGARFRTRSSGIGDLKLGGLLRLFRGESGPWTQQLHLNAGLSVPTGGLHHRDRTPLGAVRLPYPMQIGSGTVDLLPGVTYTATWGKWSGGAQASGAIRLGRNRRGYRRGHRIAAQAWGARRLTSWLSASLRAGYLRSGNYGGRDSRLNPRLISTADPGRRGFRRVDIGGGLNFIVPRGPLAGNRFAVELVRPVWQRVQGPQLETDWMITAGWEFAFRGS